MSGIAAVFVVVLVAVLAGTGRDSGDAPLAVLPVAAPADPLPRVKSRPLVFDLYADKPRNDAVDSGTASEARARRASARRAAAKPVLAAVSSSPAPVAAAPVVASSAAVTPVRATVSTTSSAPRAAAPSTASPKRSTGVKRRKIRPTFKRGVLRTPDLTIRITSYAVVAAGQGDNQYGDKPVIAFSYRTTNVSGKKVSAAAAFIFAFDAFQDTDPNVDNELDRSFAFDGSPDSTENIKKGRTVANVEAFDLDDLTTSVKLIGSEDFEPIGKTTYRLK